MSYYPELGSGQVDYRQDRPMIHFGSSQKDIDTAIRASRMRANGFVLTTPEPK